MTDDESPEPEEGGALRDFNEGFLAGRRGEPLDKSRSSTYKNAHVKGRESARRWST